MVALAPARARRVREERTSRRALRTLEQVAAGGTPVVAGPWLSEVGFEVLYWIPLLAWLRDEHGLDPARVTAVTRGGAGAWYANVAARTLEALDFSEPDEVRAWHRLRAETGSEKQSVPTRGDERLFEAAAGGADSEWLHPSLMYHLYNVALRWTGDVRLLTRQARYEPLPPAPEPPLALPASYVAVKAYFSRCFPPTAENRAFLGRSLEELASRSPVVLLRTPTTLDDHADEVDAPAGIVTYTATEGRTNLAAQSAIVAASSALVSTYGGFSYLGAFLGVPTFTFYSERAFNPLHVEVQKVALASLGADPQTAQPQHVSAFDPKRVGRNVAGVA
jgi:hypothetical protein